MNLWECEAPGCRSTAVGVGGAVGLRVVGWWFVRGGPLLCPRHRPDPVPCREQRRPAPTHLVCSECSAEGHAALLQAGML